MAITGESTSTRILLTIKDSRGPFILQRAFYTNKTWLTWTDTGFVFIPEETEEETELPEPLPINAGDFVDSFDLQDGLYEYRYIPVDLNDEIGNKHVYSQWIKFGNPQAIGYSFNNYSVPEGAWGTIVTPDDMRYTYLWGTDFKAANGTYFTDEQIQYFIDEAVCYMERQLNITIKKRVIKSQATERGLKKGVDYTDEESYYDFSFRKIQRYGMIATNQRPIINVTKLDLIYRGQNSHIDLLDSMVLDRRKGVIKFMKRPFKNSNRYNGIADALGMYGSETFQPHLFYSIDYEAGYETSDDVPADLRQMIGKVVAISLLNVIGDGLMSGFSSSSLSMDGISESFSSTQSATSAYFGARIAVYQKEVEKYIEENRHKFGYMPVGAI